MDTRTAILIATTNHGKLREFCTMLAGLPVELTALRDYPGLPEPLEDADTFEGNARLKALYYARATGSWTLADDSGLQVDALGGEPGVRSARYAAPTLDGKAVVLDDSSVQGWCGDELGPARCDDAANNARLIEKLAGVPPEKRTARFRCAIALASPDKVLETATGVVEGVIIDDPRGANGFGYDPHFFVPGLGMTTAEMPLAQKNRISHRGRALRAIRPAIERLLTAAE